MRQLHGVDDQYRSDEHAKRHNWDESKEQHA
jgi:hypothetical protein